MGGTMKKNIVIIGMPGCGKSTIGKILSERLNKSFCDVDKYIEETTKRTIPDIFKSGESHFRDIEEKAIEEISCNINQVISAGGGVVVRKNNIINFKKNGVIIFINRPLENIISDIDMESRPLLKEGIDKLKKTYENRIHLYKEYSDFEILNDSTLDDVILDIEELIKQELINQEFGGEVV
jgi:shikimate kinase